MVEPFHTYQQKTHMSVCTPWDTGLKSNHVTVHTHAMTGDNNPPNTSADPNVPAEPEGQAVRNVSAAPRGTETVLLAEDEPTVRQLAARILRRQGYTVLEAADGAEALALVERSQDVQIDLLLTDIVMPRMGGYALMERLRQLRPTIKVLLTSGYTDSTTIIVNRLDYGVEFLGKPFTPASLARKVREVLDTQP